MSKQVIIGIVVRHKITEEKRTNCLIRDEVKQAIFDNGGIAIGILSPNEEIMYAENDWKESENLIKKDQVIKQIRLCDGIIYKVEKQQKYMKIGSQNTVMTMIYQY